VILEEPSNLILKGETILLSKIKKGIKDAIKTNHGFFNNEVLYEQS
jgi:hypothetical protein